MVGGYGCINELALLPPDGKLPASGVSFGQLLTHLAAGYSECVQCNFPPGRPRHAMNPH